MATILVVDDRSINRQFLATLLGSCGHRVVEAADGAEALETVRARRPDLVITDIIMPTMDGTQLARELRADPALAQVPVIFYTATFRLTEAEQLAQGCGVSHVLPKPSDPQVILETVNRVLGISAGVVELSPVVVSSARAAAQDPVVLVGNTLSDYSLSLHELHGQMNAMVQRGPAPEAQRAELDSLSDTLKNSLADLQRLSLRVAALLEAQLEVASQTHPDPLLQVFVRAAQDILSARYAAVGLLDERGERLSRFLARGMDPEIAARMASMAPRSGPLGVLLAERRSQRLSNLKGDPQAAGLPPGHPAIHSFLAVPLMSPKLVYGWIYVADRLGADEFTEEDEELALTFATQAAVAYENAMRLSEIQRRVGELSAEIAERKRAEEALRRSEGRYRELIENAAYGIYRSTSEGKFLDVNAALVAMLGYDSKEELITKNVYNDLYRYPEHRQRVLEQARQAAGLHGVEVEWKRKDGSPFTVRLSGRVVRNEGGDPDDFEVIAEDVTERRAIEDRLRQSQKMQAIGQLAGGVAHDFNNLLGIILGYSELFLDDPSLPSRVHGKLKQVKEAADRAASLTRQLLAFSRQQVLEPVVLDLNSAVQESAKLLRRLLPESIELRFQTSPELGRVKADRTQIEQVLMNLAVNARDAMPQGGALTIETTNVEMDAAYLKQHRVARPGPYVMLAVSDTGVGMDAQTQARIFEPFFTTKEMGKGTGLGLATVYGIVKQSEGFVWVYSEPGMGTTFKVYLPRVEETVQPVKPHEVRLESLAGTETVLVVEDAEALRELVSESLQPRGYHVLTAASGPQALEMSENHEGPIHLLLTDVIMPAMNGPELVEQLKRHRPETKVLYISGYASDALGHHAVLEPQATFLQKPFGPLDLQRKVREVLDA